MRVSSWNTTINHEIHEIYVREIDIELIFQFTVFISIYNFLQKEAQSAHTQGIEPLTSETLNSCFISYWREFKCKQDENTEHF